MANYFVELNAIDLTGKIEKKNGLSYVSWSYAWQEVKKRFPDSTYTIYENSEGLNYHTDGKTCWVKTGVTVNGIEHIEYLPIMDFRNKSIEYANVTSMDVNKAIQRSLTKACARHGLGLYVYAREDLPEQVEDHKNESFSSISINTSNKVETLQKAPSIPSQNESLEEMIKKCSTEKELSDLYNNFKTQLVSNQRLLELVTAKGKSFKEVA